MAGLRNPFQEIVNQKIREGKVVTYDHKVSAELDRQISDVFHEGQKKAMARQARSLELLRSSSYK